jgi:hypothetical protein
VVVDAQGHRAATSGLDFRIAGTVYDATSGQTLPGARISLGSTAANHAPDRSVLTGPDGSFSFDRLAADKYQMYGEAVGYPQQGFEQHEAPFLTGVVVGPNISSDHLVFRLQRGSVISGEVVDEFNDPVRAAQVMLFRRGLGDGSFSTHFVREAQTDDQGHYKFAPLLPGTYFVAVSAKPWYARASFDESSRVEATTSAQMIANMKRLDVAFPLTFYSGASEASEATPIPLRSGDRATADFSLHSVPAARIIIQSSTAASGQVPFVRLSQATLGDFDLPVVQTEQRDFARPAPSGGSASMEIVQAGLAPGRYLAHVTIPGVDNDRVQEIEISGDTTIDVDSFQASASAAIHGIVRTASGAAVSPTVAIILRELKTDQTRGERPNEKGEFNLAGMQPGTYEVSIANSTNDYLLQMISPNAKVNGRSLTIGSAQTAELAITLGKGMGEINGVALRDGKGLGGTLVLLVPANPDANPVLFRRDQSDSDGTFALQRIVPGQYSVVAIEDGWDLEWSKSAVLRPYIAKAEQIDVAANGKYDVKVQVQKK